MEQVVISQRKIEYEQENHDAAEEDAQTGYLIPIYTPVISWWTGTNRSS
jgi:hypothetical protein